MKPISSEAFDRKHPEAAKPVSRHDAHMIRAQMNRGDWLILGTLAVIWGGAFFFIGVAVRHVPPLTYVWLRLTIAASAMWLVLRFRGEKLGLPRGAWASIFLLALLNNALPFALFGWGQTHIASGLASILNATTPIWGVVVAHVLTHDERMSPRKIAGVLLGVGGVAVMIGPSLLSSLGSSALAQLACVTASLCYALAAVWARRFRQMGVSPLSVTTGQLTAGSAWPRSTAGCLRPFRRPRFGKQLSRFGTGPVEVADVTPDFLALRIVKDRGRQDDIRPQRRRQRHLRIVIGRKVGHVQFLEE